MHSVKTNTNRYAVSVDAVS